MKRIEALIRPEKLHEVAEALIAAGVEDLNLSEVRGVGRQHRQKMCYRGIEYSVEFVTRTRLDVLVSDGLCDSVIEAILASARTGAAGDGIIVVQDYSDAIPICLENASAADEADALLPADEPANVPDEPVLSHRRMGVAALITTLTKLLGLAGARWHDLFP
jgi:nitrogen regulatory protein P-II 1